MATDVVLESSRVIILLVIRLATGVGCFVMLSETSSILCLVSMTARCFMICGVVRVLRIILIPGMARMWDGT